MTKTLGQDSEVSGDTAAPIPAFSVQGRERAKRAVRRAKAQARCHLAELPVDAEHFGFLTDDRLWYSDQRGCWMVPTLIEAIRNQHLLPQSSGTLNCVLWGTPWDGWLVSGSVAWRCLDGAELTPVNIAAAGLPLGRCGSPPFHLVAAGPDWFATGSVFGGEVRVVRSPPPATARGLLDVLRQRELSRPWAVAVVGQLGASSTRLLATGNGQRFAVISAGGSHLIGGPISGISVSVDPDGHPESGALHPDGDLLAVCSRSLTLVGVNGTHFTIPTPLRRAAAFSKDGRYLVFCTGGDGMAGQGDLVAWDLLADDARTIGNIQYGGHQTRIEFSSSGRRLGVAGTQLRVFSWTRIVAVWGDLPQSAAQMPLRTRSRPMDAP